MYQPAVACRPASRGPRRWAPSACSSFWPLLSARSIDALVAYVTCAARCELAGVVVHVGSGRGQSIEDAERHVVSGMEQVLAAGAATGVLLENSAGPRG